MYVCVCNAVTEKQIFQAAQKGAKTLKDLKKTLGVANECGRCATCAKNCLSDAHAALTLSNSALGTVALSNGVLNKTVNIAVRVA